MLEYILILVAALFIGVLFYKQANDQLEILLLESARQSELPNLLQERSPVILRGYTTPALGTPAECKKRPSLAPLFQYDPATFPLQTRKALAQESGLDIWFEHTWMLTLTTPLTRFYTTTSSKMIIKEEGLQLTTAPLTVFMPTQGECTLTLMIQTQLPFLPKRWKGRQFSQFTAQDSPLLNQIQYTEVVLRKGHILFLPAHLLFDIQQTPESKEEAWIYCVELHHPISRIRSSLD